MGIFKKIPAWLIGGLFGIIYFLITLGLTELTCPNNCYEGGWLYLILNIPAIFIIFIISPIFGELFYNSIASILGVAILDFIFGSIFGFLINLAFLSKGRLRPTAKKIMISLSLAVLSAFVASILAQNFFIIFLVIFFTAYGIFSLFTKIKL